MSHKIYSMELHQVIEINMDYKTESGYDSKPMEVMRVPGGWIYGVGTENSVLVPYSADMKDIMDGVAI